MFDDFVRLYLKRISEIILFNEQSKVNKIWAIFALLLNFQLLLSTTTDTTNYYKFSLGFLIGASRIEHSTDLPIIMGNDNCGSFSEGLSFGKSIGLSLSYNYINNLCSINSKLFFSNFDASFSTNKTNFRVYNPINNDYENVYINYSFNSNVTIFKFQPTFIIQPVKQIPLKLSLGVEINNPLSIPKYYTNEEIISPRVFTFPDQTQKHIIDNGTLTDLATSFSTISALQYELPIRDRLFLNFELFYQHPLSSKSGSFRWETFEYGLNIMLGYGFNSLFLEKEIIQEPTKIGQEPIDIPAKQIVVNFEPTSLVLKPKPIKVLETTITEAYPLLPYIFFDEKSEKLNQKYLQNWNEDFDESSLTHNSIEIYYRVLDIIGKRLNKNRKARITIIGHSDGIEFPTKKEREEIALRRAKVVANYLIDKWNVKNEQIKIEYRDKPILSTSDIYEQGPSENRRVEIKTDDNLLLKPVILTKFKEYRVLSDKINIDFISNNMDSLQIKNFEIIGQKIYGLNKTRPDNIEIPIDKLIQEKISYCIENTDSLDCRATYWTNDTLKSSTVVIPYEIEKNTFEYQRLNLIVFDFDKYQISPMNYEILKNFVANSIQEDSEVRIIGSTDVLGTKEYNLQLSKQRALETRKTLQQIKPNTNFVEVDGIGDINHKYDNSTPEGRFYSRTVLIEVKTPIKNK